MNLVVLRGYVGKKPQITIFSNGGSVARFSLATKRHWRDRTTGETKSKTDWHRIRVYASAKSSLVSRIEQFVSKGSHLLINGILSENSFIDKDGKRIPLVCVDVHSSDGIKFLDPRSESDNSNTDNQDHETEMSPELPDDFEDMPLSDEMIDALEHENIPGMDIFE